MGKREKKNHQILPTKDNHYEILISFDMNIFYGFLICKCTFNIVSFHSETSLLFMLFQTVKTSFFLKN